MPVIAGSIVSLLFAALLAWYFARPLRTLRQALAAVTVNAAHALGLGESHGALEPGRQADLVVWDVPGHAQIPYWVGANLARIVVKGGRVAHARE